MRTYSFTLSVPDNFDPEQLNLELSYPESDGEIVIEKEGYFDATALLDKVKLSEIKGLTKDSKKVLIFKFPPELNEFDCVYQMQQTLEKQFPNCTVMGLVDDIDLLAENQAEAIDMLKKMIDKVNLRSSIKIQ